MTILVRGRKKCNLPHNFQCSGTIKLQISKTANACLWIWQYMYMEWNYNAVPPVNVEVLR